MYPYFNPTLLPYDLTRGGIYYAFNGHTDVKELALYIRDVITKGNWSLNIGLARRSVQRSFHRAAG